jgi:hypothetical protein
VKTYEMIAKIWVEDGGPRAGCEEHGLLTFGGQTVASAAVALGEHYIAVHRPAVTVTTYTMITD